jgi:hypothetical protein
MSAAIVAAILAYLYARTITDFWPVGAEVANVVGRILKFSRDKRIVSRPLKYSEFCSDYDLMNSWRVAILQY